MIPGDSDRTTFWEHIYRYRFAAPFVRNKRVLDIACGEGYGSAGMARAGAKSVFGIDIALEACRSARTQYQIAVCAADATEIPIRSHSIDIIVSFETIEHTRNPDLFLDECVRVLTYDGTLMLSTPNKETYRHFNKQNPYHYSELERYELAAMLKRRFRRIYFYSQQPTADCWWTRRPLAVNNSPWLRLKGFWRLRKRLIERTCPHIKGDIARYRALSVQSILAKDKMLSSFVNPYYVAKQLPFSEDKPVYLVVLAQL
jgi:SAM-dependent methyltransferase